MIPPYFEFSQFFTVENVKTETTALDGKITKRFKSRAKGDVRIFKWEFGDGTPIVETDKRVVYHTYDHPGRYLLRHQACNFSWCCSEWCSEYIKVRKEEEEDHDHEHDDHDHHDHDHAHNNNTHNNEHNNDHNNNMSLISQLLEDPAFNIKDVDFIVEDLNAQSLNGSKFTKKFTSLASTATIFRWDFGDGEDLETSDNPIYHSYDHAGKYDVGHQSCIGPLCCSGWCVKTIKVLPPSAAAPALLFGGLGFMFLAAKRDCEAYDNKKDCEEARLYLENGKPRCRVPKPEEKLKEKRKPCCDWIEKDKKDKKCVPRCETGYERKIIKNKYTCIKIK